MLQEVMFAGFGGQGVVLGATVLANMAASADMHATIIPSYGNEQRGGAAYCECKFCPPDEEIFDPRFDHPTVLISMNEFAYQKYGESVADGGLILYNEDAPDQDFSATEGRVRLVKIPCTTIADSLGDSRAANFVMMGAAVKLGGFFTEEYCVKFISDYFMDKKPKFAELNINAFKAGYAQV